MRGVVQRAARGALAAPPRPGLRTGCETGWLWRADATEQAIGAHVCGVCGLSEGRRARGARAGATDRGADGSKSTGSQSQTQVTHSPLDFRSTSCADCSSRLFARRSHHVLADLIYAHATAAGAPRLPLRSSSAGRPSRSRWAACSSCAAAGAKALEPFHFAAPMVNDAAAAELGRTSRAHPSVPPHQTPHFFSAHVSAGSCSGSAKFDVPERWRHPATGAQVFDEKLSQAGWRTPSTHWLSARSRPPVPTAIDLTNCCEQVSSRVASGRWCCSAWPRTGVPPPARLEAAEFDSPMGRP